MVELEASSRRIGEDPSGNIGSSIEFCPETGAMTIRFVGGRFTGLPAWSLELLALAAGATTLHIDLTEVELDNPDRAEATFRSVLASDHGLTAVTFAHRRATSPETAGSKAS